MFTARYDLPQKYNSGMFHLYVSGVNTDEHAMETLTAFICLRIKSPCGKFYHGVEPSGNIKHGTDWIVIRC